MGWDREFKSSNRPEHQLEEDMRILRKVYRRIRQMNSWMKVHDRFKMLLDHWRVHGKETFEDDGVRELKAAMAKKKIELLDMFLPYNKRYCKACEGACCYPLWGGFTSSEMICMDVSERTNLHREMTKKKKDIEFLWHQNQCMFWGPERGCKLPKELRSVLCVAHICPILRNVIQGEDRVKIERLCTELEDLLGKLMARVSGIRDKHGLPKLKEKKPVLAGFREKLNRGGESQDV